MKVIKYTLFSFIFLVTVVVGNAQVTQDFTYSSAEVTASTQDSMNIVQLKKATLLSGEDYVGNPQLPVVSIKLALPQGQKATSVTVTANQQTTLSGTFNLVSVPEPQSLGFVKKERKSENFKVKHNAAVYPPNFLLDFTNHQYRQYSYVTVRFIPFSYNAQTGSLDLLTQVTISVSTAASALGSV